MKAKKPFIALALIFMFSMMYNTLPVQAHSGDVFSAYATVTPTLDGNIGTGEWNDADSKTFALSYSGESHECTLYVKNDNAKLYLALLVKGDDYSALHDWVLFTFDNDHDGSGFLNSEIGDDRLDIRGDGFTRDLYWPGADLQIWAPDTMDGGTNDIEGASGHTNPSGTPPVGDYTFELSHPLNTNDDTHDFSLSTGDTVGFSPVFVDYDPIAQVYWYARWPPSLYADIVVAPIPTIYVDPPSLTQPLSSTFDVNVSIRDVDAAIQFIGLDFRLSYNPSLLEVVDVTEGEFLQDPEWNVGLGTFFVWGDKPDDAFWGPHVLVLGLLLPNASGFWNPPFPHGSGTIATITFHCIGLGESALHFLDVHVVGVEGPAQEPVYLSYETEDGLVKQVPNDVDIKPGSWPNPINVRSKGVFPVAICGTEDFDVETVDPTTVKLYIAGIAQGVSPIRWTYRDVATPYTGPPGGGHALSGDGYLDLVFFFDIQTVVTKLGLAGHVGETIPLIIKGNLYPAAGALPIQGQDYVQILKK